MVRGVGMSRQKNGQADDTSVYLGTMDVYRQARLGLGLSRVGPLADCSLVAPRVYLGNGNAARDLLLLNQLGITLVVNLADDLALAGHAELASRYHKGSTTAGITTERTQSGNFTRRSLPLPDNPGRQFDVLSVLSRDKLLEDLVRELQSDGKHSVLLHCVAGSNRSATVACALLMSMHGCTAADGLSWLQRLRPIVKPAPLYQKSLLLLEQRLKVDTTAPLIELQLLTAVQVGDHLSVQEAPLPESIGHFELELAAASGAVSPSCACACVVL